MSNAFSRALGTPPTQMEQALPEQVQNNAGGFVFGVTPQTRLERFLILGTEGGTYYVQEKQLTKDNVEFLIKMIQADEETVIETVQEISESGRAYRNTAAIFAVAALFRYGQWKPSSLVLRVCRTATHLFQFAEFVELLGGWSRSTRRAVADWYRAKYQNNTLALQVVKYRQRNGWTHRDLFRLAHPVGFEEEWKAIGSFIIGKESLDDHLPPRIKKFKLAQEAQTIADLASATGLPWECFPTSFHKNLDFWRWLFNTGQLDGQALVRNITRLARLNAFNDMRFTREFANRLVDEDMIRKSRLHPMQYLLALTTHVEGQIPRSASRAFYWGPGEREKDWQTSEIIVDALNEGFYKAFKSVQPANKRTLVGLDVSGSMTSLALGIDLTCAQVAAAMAMTIMRTEPYYKVMAFASNFRDLGLTVSMDLNDVLTRTNNMTFGRTDCSLPILYANNNNIEVDTFVIITDNETWAGTIHPYQALEAYRRKTGIDSKLIVVGLASTGFSIANPADRGMMDVVGGDANLPAIIADFSAGRI